MANYRYAMMSYSQVPQAVGSTMGWVMSFYRAQTDSGKPSSGVKKGDFCFCEDTGVLYKATGDNVWTDVAAGGGVPTSRAINTTAPVTGGGDLSADRTIAVSDSTSGAKGVVQLAGDLGGSAASPTVPGLTAKEATANKNAANGYCGLDANALVAFSQIPATHDQLRKPPFFDAANLTAVTALATNTSYFVYLGRIMRPITTIDVLTRVTTLAATITWAEVGVFTGSPVINGNASLTRKGFTNVAATFNTTGIKKTTVSLSGVNAGDELWIAFGSQATTPYQLRGGLADDIQSGWYATFAGRISTMATPSTVTLAGAAAVPPWCSGKV